MQLYLIIWENMNNFLPIPNINSFFGIVGLYDFEDLFFFNKEKIFFLIFVYCFSTVVGLDGTDPSLAISTKLILLST